MEPRRGRLSKSNTARDRLLYISYGQTEVYLGMSCISCRIHDCSQNCSQGLGTQRITPQCNRCLV